MLLRGARCSLRPWRVGDEVDLVASASDPEIWRNLKDRFPNPYTHEDAESWIRFVRTQGQPPQNFALVAAGRARGGVGLERKTDVYRGTAEIGYWVARSFWGQGLATEAVQLAARHAFGTLQLTRLEARVFEWNTASCRVLEKAGFQLEARLRRSVFKDGQLIDSFLYARLSDDGV